MNIKNNNTSNAFRAIFVDVCCKSKESNMNEWCQLIKYQIYNIPLNQPLQLSVHTLFLPKQTMHIANFLINFISRKCSHFGIIEPRTVRDLILVLREIIPA